MCCSFVIPCVRYFSTVLQFHLWSRDWVMCCSFVITRVWVYFFQQSYPIPTYEAGIEWCAAFDYVLRYFSTVLQFPPIKQGLSDVLLFFVITCVRVFSTVLQFPPISRDWGDVLFCDCFLFVITCVIITVLPNSTYKAGIEWCAALLWLHVS
jgi:hypothetical protein